MLKVNMDDGAGVWCLRTLRLSQVRVHHSVSSHTCCPAAPCSGVLLACPMFGLPLPISHWETEIDLNSLLSYKLVWDDSNKLVWDDFV